MTSSCISAFEKRTYKIAKKGGKNRYIPLNAVYIINNAAYRSGVKEFL